MEISGASRIFFSASAAFFAHSLAFSSSALAAVRKVASLEALEKHGVREAVQPLVTSADRQLREAVKEFLRGLDDGARGMAAPRL